jgi:hypothetical protein
LHREAEAAPVLQRSIDSGVRERDVLLAAGRAWLRTDDIDKARIASRLLESTVPAWIETQMLLGDVADAGQDWTRAAAHYQAAIQLDAAAAQPRYSLGLALYKERAYDIPESVARLSSLLFRRSGARSRQRAAGPRAARTRGNARSVPRGYCARPGTGALGHGSSAGSRSITSASDRAGPRRRQRVVSLRPGAQEGGTRRGIPDGSGQGRGAEPAAARPPPQAGVWDQEELSRCHVPRARCQVPGARCQVPGARCQVPGASTGHVTSQHVARSTPHVARRT